MHCGGANHSPITDLFVPLLQALMEEDNLLLEIFNNVIYTTVAMTTTNPTTSVATASLHTDAAPVVVPTRRKVAQPRGSSSLSKPLPWNRLRPFILECELSDHPDRVFARQLIENLRQGCKIG